MSLVEHARIELNAIGLKPDADDAADRWMYESVIALISAFAEQGHSGFSASIAIETFRKLARFEPLQPLQGTDDEWVQVADDIWQNKRCGRVFREADGRAYDIEGIVWRDPNGSCCTNRESRVYVQFPYSPKTEYRNRS